MPKLTVTNISAMKTILEVFSRLDDIRWESFATSATTLLNYAARDLSADEKLLSHWLCYITDRQTPFRRVWEVGGYVISHLVRAYTREKRRSFDDVLSSYVMKTENGKPYLSCPLEGQNDRLARYGIRGPDVDFASRYMPEDIILMYRTLGILDKLSRRSLARYMSTALDAASDGVQAIRSVAVALDDLTYIGSGAVSAGSLATTMRATDTAISRFTRTQETDRELFNRKRLWCSLRDFIKSKEFNTEFVTALRDVGLSSPGRWSRAGSLNKAGRHGLELPGDVWNNSEVFRAGLFNPYLANERSSSAMPATVRAIYECLSAEEPLSFYPEQLDVSFEFVPRMCDKGMCDICFFGKGIGKVCHQVEGLLCSVALVTCGYRRWCDPAGCGFKNDDTSKLCHSIM